MLTEQSPELRFDFIDTIDIEVSPRRTQKKQKKKKKLIRPPALSKKFESIESGFHNSKLLS